MDFSRKEEHGTPKKLALQFLSPFKTTIDAKTPNIKDWLRDAQEKHNSKIAARATRQKRALRNHLIDAERMQRKFVANIHDFAAAQRLIWRLLALFITIITISIEYRQGDPRDCCYVILCCTVVLAFFLLMMKACGGLGPTPEELAAFPGLPKFDELVTLLELDKGLDDREEQSNDNLEPPARGPEYERKRQAYLVGRVQQLQPSELFALQQMRAAFSKSSCIETRENIGTFRLDDSTFLRFLTARQFDFGKARQMLETHLVWRDAFVPAKIKPSDVATGIHTLLV
jgi:hypothetical protein